MATMFAIVHLFMPQGWDVISAKSVAGALGLLDPAPDWIVLDLGLSDGDGEEILRHVRQKAIPSRVAVISAPLDADRMERLQQLAPDALLTKPVSFARLAAVCGVDSSASPDAV